MLTVIHACSTVRESCITCVPYPAPPCPPSFAAHLHAQKKASALPLEQLLNMLTMGMTMADVTSCANLAAKVMTVGPNRLAHPAGQTHSQALVRGFVVDLTLPCLHAGVSRQQAQGQGIWSIFQLPAGRGKPEELYGHPIRESLQFSVVAIGTAKQQCLSLTFRCVDYAKATCSFSLFLPVAVCLSVCLSLCVFLSVCLCAFLCIRPSVCLSVSQLVSTDLCTCRAASSDMMDEHMPSIGIPNFVDFMRRKAKSFYFCFVTTMEKGPMPAASPAGTAL